MVISVKVFSNFKKNLSASVFVWTLCNHGNMWPYFRYFLACSLLIKLKIRSKEKVKFQMQIEHIQTKHNFQFDFKYKKREVFLFSSFSFQTKTQNYHKINYKINILFTCFNYQNFKTNHINQLIEYLVNFIIRATIILKQNHFFVSNF